MNEDDDKQGLLGQMFGAWNRVRENPIADVALGFTPAGFAADAQDAGRAIRDRDALGLALAGAGFIPVVGDVVKTAAKKARGFLPKLAGSVEGAVRRSPGQDIWTPGDTSPYTRDELVEEGLAKARPAGTGPSMAPDDRVARMVDQGYDVLPDQFFETGYGPRGGVMYHASRSGSFDVEDMLDKPMWMTPNASQAETYAPHGFVLPVVSRPGRNLFIDAQGRNWDDLTWDDVGRALLRAEELGDEDAMSDVWRVINDTYGGNVSGPRADEITSAIWRGADPDSGGLAATPADYPVTTDEIASVLKDAGFDSADFSRIADVDADGYEQVFGELMDDELPPDMTNRMYSRVVFDPSRIRHIDADFDEKRISERNLLAGLAALLGGGTAVRSLGQNNREER